MVEILWNEVIKDYTFKEEIKGVKSIKKVPIKFKLEDTTSRFRKEILKREIFQ
jgi:rRNA maturation protein Nop10